MDTVYLLQHVREDDEHGDDAKLIGVYRSSNGAEAAVERLRALPGFRDHKADFRVDSYRLDDDHWTGGFVSQ